MDYKAFKASLVQLVSHDPKQPAINEVQLHKNTVSYPNFQFNLVT